MILDTSAVIAIFLKEPGFERLVEQLAQAELVGIGAPTMAETAIVLTSRLGRDARPHLARFLTEARAEVVPFGDEHWQAAAEAYLRFGKGRSAAQLNFGDCMAYATARLANEPLLALGNDFPQTDIALA